MEIIETSRVFLHFSLFPGIKADQKPMYLIHMNKSKGHSGRYIFNERSRRESVAQVAA